MDGNEAPANIQQVGVASLADFAPEVFQRFFNANPITFLTTHHLESYDAFVFKELPELIIAENPITILKEPLDAEKGIYKYKTEIFVGGLATTPEELALEVGAPILTLDGGTTVRRMFPNDARIRDLTYAATFRATILVRLTFSYPSRTEDGEETTETGYRTQVRDLTFENFNLFRIPILLRSKLCATYQAPKSLLMDMGECRNDAGGYFVVDGAEKVLITRQEQAFNSIYVSVKPPSDLKIATYASVICMNPTSKQTRRVALYRLHASGGIEEGAIRISIPLVKGAIPVFALFRALGVISDKDIVRMILPDTQSSQTNAMENTLIASIHDAHPISTQLQAVEFIRTLTKGFIVENVLNILHEHLFCHVPDKPLARAQYLAELIRKMIRVEMRMEPNTNRDDIRNQRLLPTGTLLSGLFSECWKDWKKAVRLKVDVTYNYNRTLYENENFLNIFSTGNISNVLSSSTLNDSIMRGFRGKWGTNQYNMKSGVVQPLARISYLDAMSHTRRVVSDFDTSMKLVGPRQLNPSQIGYFCTAETPTGGHIGATKNLSILTAISIPASADPVMTWLLSRGGVTDVSAATHDVIVRAASVQINGGTIGFSVDPATLTRVLKIMKWTACLPPTASVSFNTTENVLRIYLDDGRPLRPLWHLGEGGKWPAVTAVRPLPKWRDLVCGTFPGTKGRDIYSSTFFDPLADWDQSHDGEPTLDDYEHLLAEHCGAIEYVDPYESNEAYISWYGPLSSSKPGQGQGQGQGQGEGGEGTEHTHAEIHPSSLMGLLASMVPFSNHNQSPRNQLSCSQSKQAIGYYATNYANRFDTYGSMLCYGEGAMARTIVNDAVGDGEMIYGTNVIFCINSFNGYNQDDGILFNKSSIERGLFRSIALRSYKAVEEDDPMTKATYRMGAPRMILSWTDLKPGYDYSSLDDTGVIKKGTKIHDKSVLVGMYLTNPETGAVADASVVPTVFTQGRVEEVVVIHQANGMRLVHIRILEERIPELGDKFSSRHGQKGTMGMLLDAQDMPRTAEGLVPDIIVNPHCIPSRMTIAQLLEQLFGKLGAIMGAKMNATAFMNEPDSYQSIGDALETLGFQRDGEEILYSGITGRMFTTSVFMGPLYFMRLKHLTQDKLNARGKGRKEMRTHQPTGGRGNEGGMRIGEMERDSLLGHGVTEFLHESMMKRSDGDFLWICNGCGTIPIYNEAQKLFVCALCDGPLSYQGETVDTIGLVLPVKKSRTTFSQIEVPYALKLMEQELTTYANISFRFLTEKNMRTFRPLPAILTGVPDKEPLESLMNTLMEGIVGEAPVEVKEPPPALAPIPENSSVPAADSVKVIKMDENAPVSSTPIPAPAPIPISLPTLPTPASIPSLVPESTKIGGGRPLTNEEIDALYLTTPTPTYDEPTLQTSLGGDSSISAIVSSQAQQPPYPLWGSATQGQNPMMTMQAPPPTIIMMTQPQAPAPAPAPAPPKGPVAAAPTLAIGPVIGTVGETAAQPPPTGQTGPPPASDIKTIKIDVPM